MMTTLFVLLMPRPRGPSAAAGLSWTSRPPQDPLSSPTTSLMAYPYLSRYVVGLQGLVVEGIVDRQSAIATIVAVLAASALSGTGTTAQSCNPVVDGTYCATQGGRAFSGSSSSTGLQPIQSLSDDLSLGQQNPATFAGVSFSSNDTICIGFLRRSGCN
jgi:hypothetical protein